MVQALHLLQADLDAAELHRFRLSFAVAGGVEGFPVVNVQWRGTWTGESVALDPDGLAESTVDVAGHTTQGLIELEGIYFPTCPTHKVRARAEQSARRAAVWTCHPHGHTPHELSRIGDLAVMRTRSRTDDRLWRSLNELGSR
jgi:hypothetical protein